MPIGIENYEGSNKILRLLTAAKGSYSSLSDRMTAIEESAAGGGAAMEKAEEAFILATDAGDNAADALLHSNDALEKANEALDSTNVEVTNVNLTSTNVEDAIEEVRLMAAQAFQSANDGKDTIATALIGKGQDVDGNDTYTDLATAITNIQSGTAHKITKLNVTAPYTKDIVLDNPRTLENLCTSILEFGGGQEGHSQYDCGFDNGDMSNFSFDSDYVTFDGAMKLISSYTSDMANNGALGSGVLYSSPVITLSDFSEISSLTANNTSLVLTAVPSPQIVKASGDIDLSDVETLTSIALTKTEASGGKVRMLISVDQGVTWKSYYSSQWNTVDSTSKTAFAANGMTEASIEALTTTELEELRDGSTKIRFAYYLERPTVASNANTDGIVLTVKLAGVTSICSASKYTLSYNEGTKTISYAMNTSGTYIYNYDD